MRRISISAIAVMACMLAAASSAAAQDLGEAARLERERKANLARHAPVLTNEDLGKDRIVVPQTETPAVATTPAAVSPIVTKSPAAVVVASPAESSPAVTSAPAVAKAPAKVSPALVRVLPATTETQAISPQPGDPGFSLGEYARKLREQKAERLAKEQELERQAAAAAVVASVPKPPAEVHVSSAPARSMQAAKMLPARRLEVTNDVANVTPKREEKTARAEDHKTVTNDVRKQVAKSVDDQSVQVRRGDSLWRISRRHLGHGHLWTLVWKTNPQIANPQVIRIGQTVQLPSSEVVAAALARETEIRVAKAEPKQPGIGLRIFARTTSNSVENRVSSVPAQIEQPGGASLAESGSAEPGLIPQTTQNLPAPGRQSRTVTAVTLRTGSQADASRAARSTANRDPK